MGWPTITSRKSAVQQSRSHFRSFLIQSHTIPRRLQIFPHYPPSPVKPSSVSTTSAGLGNDHLWPHFLKFLLVQCVVSLVPPRPFAPLGVHQPTRFGGIVGLQTHGQPTLRARSEVGSKVQYVTAPRRHGRAMRHGDGRMRRQPRGSRAESSFHLLGEEGHFRTRFPAARSLSILRAIQQRVRGHMDGNILHSIRQSTSTFFNSLEYCFQLGLWEKFLVSTALFK